MDVVNVVHEHAGDQQDLVAALRATLAAHGERDVAGLAPQLDGIVAVARGLRRVLAAVDRDAAASGLNELLAAHAAVPRLERHGGWDWHLHVDGGADAGWARWLGASGALALARLLTEGTELPWGICDASPCERAFVHDGRGGRRRFCSSACATRTRVRRHRARTV